MPPTGTGWSIHISSNHPKVRRVGNKVYFQGTMKAAGATRPAGQVGVILYTPVGLRPQETTYLPVTDFAGGPPGARFTWLPDGEVNFAPSPVDGTYNFLMSITFADGAFPA